MHRHRDKWARGWRGGRGACGPEGRNPWRARRGDVKFFILDVLAAGPRHGYDIIAALEEKSGGRYRPSPGSVYPTLQLLEDGGFVTAAELDGKRVFTITDSGRTLLESRPPDDQSAPDAAPHPWDAFARLGAAVRQAAIEGDPATHEKLRAILLKARREVYALLAEEE
jgi:DNA-binding PadR family transcriptional regulator